MKIPEIRDEMKEMAARLRQYRSAINLGGFTNRLGALVQCLSIEADRLEELAKETKRRPYVRPKRVTSRPLTLKMQKEIREMHRDHPHLTQHEIARHFNVSDGRVSTTLKGFRK